MEIRLTCKKKRNRKAMLDDKISCNKVFLLLSVISVSASLVFCDIGGVLLDVH